MTLAYLAFFISLNWMYKNKSSQNHEHNKPPKNPQNFWISWLYLTVIIQVFKKQSKNQFTKKSKTMSQLNVRRDTERF